MGMTLRHRVKGKIPPRYIKSGYWLHFAQGIMISNVTVFIICVMNMNIFFNTSVRQTLLGHSLEENTKDFREE